MADVTGGGKVRLREYETVFLVKPDVSDENVDKIKERIRTAVAREGGKVLKFTHWGKKKTSFPVAKQQRAIFVHASYLGGHKAVFEVERNLAITEDVTKYISQRIADDIDPETRQVEADVKLVGDADERPRPEREGGEAPAAAAAPGAAVAPAAAAAPAAEQHAPAAGEGEAKAEVKA
jgi:small subunit ribosomal protein S6